YSTGDTQALADSRSTSMVPICLGFAGQTVAARDVEMDVKDKRHLAKLLPFELEEFLIDSVDDLHFVHTPLVDNRTSVLYAKNDDIAKALAPFEELKCEVPLCLPEYMFLLRQNDGVTIVFEDDVVVAHYAEGKGFTVEASLAPYVVAGLTTSLEGTQVLNLVADSPEKLELLLAWCPQAWREQEGLDIKLSQGGFWDWANPDIDASPYNFRRGKFAKQLPFRRWINHWKIPAAAVAAAFVLSVIVSYVEYFSAKNENKRIVVQIDDVYKKAIPGGRSRDPERDLESKVRTLGNKNKASNFMHLFNSVASSITGASGITLESIRYNSDQGELQLSLTGNDFGSLESMRGQVTAKGLAAEFVRIDKRSDSHSASMKVTEAK
ncbi:MAG: general secretion pathway protein GspL, partial [Cellvibrionaceae bacterium]|nr:general secretion pathway protein GspL [Cellvibrionaceae bacterium]